MQDTNVFVSALRSQDGASAAVLDRCLALIDQAYLGASLYLEYEELISRDSVWEGVPVSREEREMLFDDFCQRGQSRVLTHFLTESPSCHTCLALRC